MPLVYFVLGPHLPSGQRLVPGGVAAGGQRRAGRRRHTGVPVHLDLHRVRRQELADPRGHARSRRSRTARRSADTAGSRSPGSPSRRSRSLGLFVFATVEMAVDQGAGTGSGSSPIWTPAGYSTNLKDNKLLQVQVIGQQWRWTYRFPQYGGVETSELVLPAGQEVQFNVTSLDVIHSFWAVNLGRQGRCEPGCQQHRLRRDEEHRAGGHPVRRAVRHLPRSDGPDRARVAHQDFDTWINGQIALHQDLIPQLPRVRRLLHPADRRRLLRPGPGPAAGGRHRPAAGVRQLGFRHSVPVPQQLLEGPREHGNGHRSRRS